jgi:hypothetical protein
MSIGLAVLFVLAVMASNWHGYNRGMKKGKYEGLSGTLDHLVETGRLDVLDAIEVDPYL